MTRDELKEKATKLDIMFPENIKTEKLKGLIAEKEAGQEPVETPVEEDTESLKEQMRAEIKAELEAEFKNKLNKRIEDIEIKTVAFGRNKIISPAEIARLQKEATSLVRVNVICNDPTKQAWEGEIISAGNDVIGDVKKYVKFNTTQGYFIPRIIYNVLKTKKVTIFKQKKGKNGQQTTTPVLINAFNTVELPLPTPAELKEMAREQRVAELQADA